MLEILLALLALSGVAAIARQLLPLLVSRQTYRRTQDAAREAHEEWKRRQDQRNRKRVDRQAKLAEWTSQFNALQLERRLRNRDPEPPAEPRGEPIAYIRAWGGEIVGTIYEDPPDYRASNAAAIAHEIDLAEDLQRQRNWKP